MENMNDSDRASLGVLDVRIKHIENLLDRFERMLSLEPDTPLHNAVTVLVGKQMEKKKIECDMHTGEMINAAIQQHVTEFHLTRRSEAPDADIKRVRAFFAVAGPFLLRWVLPILAGGGAVIGGQQILNQPSPIVQNVETDGK